MSTRARNVLFTLLGAAGLVLKGRYSGPYRNWVHSYGGNLAASFAVYFVTRLPFRSAFPRALAAGVALAVVELFEALNGFGVMTNVYDPLDFVANAVGIALAVTVDMAANRATSGRSKPVGRAGPGSAEPGAV